MKGLVSWTSAAVVIAILISFSPSSSASAVTTTTLVLTAGPTESLGLTPAGVQPHVSASFHSNYFAQLSVFMWADVENSQGQTVGVYLGSATIGAAQNSTIDTALFNLSPGGYGNPGNYAVTVFATTSSGVVLSHAETLNFYYAPKTPFNHTLYLTSSGACSVFGPNNTAYAIPCSSGDFNQAYVFNCASAAASSSGCTTQIVSSLVPSNRYNITVWYPYVNQSNEPSWAICMYNAKGASGSQYAYCIPVGSTAFILSTEGPPPP